MKLGMHRKKLNKIRAAALVVLAAILCFAGCSTGQNSAGLGSTGQNSAGLHPEEMARLCYYRNVKDENFDTDMEIVEGRINALTDGNYLKEDTTVETPQGILDAVSFYVPREVYGEDSLGDISRILISRPMNLWLGNDTSTGTWNNFTDQIALPREAIESAEVLYGCPEHYTPMDYGIKLKEFTYLKITLTEEFCRENPQIWEWKQPSILQDIEGFEGYAHMRVFPDAESRCMIFSENDDRKGYSNALYYAFTHEPLSNAFNLISFPVVEWESGAAIKGAGQIENTGFNTETVVNEYVPEEEYVSDKNWEQTLQAIRERLDASGVPYALGHRPGVDRSIVIRMEKGQFTDNFLGYVISNSAVDLSSCGEALREASSGIEASVQERSGKKVLALDMSALRKEAFNKLSANCVKKGGGRIVLLVDSNAVAYGYCDSMINEGKFVMDYNAFNAENGFAGEMEWMADFWAALISGTQIPVLYSSTPAVTLQNKEQIFLNEEGQPCILNQYSIPRDNLYAEIKRELGDLEYTRIGVLTTGKPCLQFALPEGEDRNGQIAAVMSRVFKKLDDEIFTYWFRFDFVDGSGMPQLMFLTRTPGSGSKMKIGYSMYYDSGFTEEDEAEIRKLLTEDESLANLITAE